MAKVGVVLSGCGVYDGSEIHEAALTLYFLDRAGAEVICMAPNMEQTDVIDHTQKTSTGDKRNVLVESARIARGKIEDMARIAVSDLDALIFPGGRGAVKNLSDFDVKGPDCSVNPEVARIVREMHAARKPLGFICIAPVLAANLLGAYHPHLTIGTDCDMAAMIEAMGAKHVSAHDGDIVVCPIHHIVTTPAYMLGPTISHVAVGIENLVTEVLRLVNLSKKGEGKTSHGN